MKYEIRNRRTLYIGSENICCRMLTKFTWKSVVLTGCKYGFVFISYQSDSSTVTETTAKPESLQSAELYIAEVRTNHSFSSFALIRIVAFYVNYSTILKRCISLMIIFQ